ncbi:MAG TPA: glycoside hydrolase family 3 N-terminal domain-containing protein [Pilimelia sp.]|nr:glycoside hydrolase family 3 N-terminal domain-containing protein [Pilimelia sp.]
MLTVAGGCGDPEPRPAPAPPPPTTAAASPSPPPAPTDPAAVRAAAVVATLADADLVGQVLMPYAYGSYATKVSSGSAAGNRDIAGVATPAEMIAKYRLGGLILVGWSADDPTSGNQPTTNIDSPAQVRSLTAGLQAAAAGLPARAPLLIGTDQEFGVVTRVKEGVTVLPSAMAFGAAGNAKLTEAAWRAAGAELATLGVNVNFAPVADVLGEGGSTVIGSRSYGADTAAAAAQVAAAVRGMRAAGVAATVKHFPGHGHTTADSHTDLPVLGQSRTALEREDLPPFAAGIAAGAGLVMSGHLDVRAVDPGVPATFSHRTLTGLLRGQLAFGGVVVTDALNMAPAKRWPPAEAALRALLAGNDLLLMPPDLPAVHAGLSAALADGRLPRARLVEAATRVLTLKFRLAAGPAPGGLASVGAPAHVAAVAALSRAAVTQLRGPCGGARAGGTVTVTASGGRERARGWLVASLHAVGVRVVDSGGTVVHLVGYGDGPGDLNPAAAVTVAMDTPYLLASSSSRVLLATYSSSRLSMAALAAVLAGKAAAPGRSPVAVRGLPRTACA